MPLLERHLGLSSSGISTKGVDMRGTHPQSGCKHAEEAANIGGSLGDLLVTLGACYISTPPLTWNHHPGS